MKKFVGIILMWFIIWGGSAEALSMNVAGGSAGQLIRFAAREGNLDVIMDDSTDAKVSIVINDVSPKEAIKKIALAGGLSLSEEKGTIFIGRGKGIRSQLGKVYVIPIMYGDLAEMKSQVELYIKNKQITDIREGDKKGQNTEITTGENALNNKAPTNNKANTGSSEKNTKPKKNVITGKDMTDKIAKVGMDINSHSLLVYGTKEEAAGIKDLIDKLDVPPKQIALEAKVLAVNKTEAERLGINWEWSKLPHDFTYGALVEALISKGKGRILSKPNIVTMQGREAVINIGGEVPIPSVSVTNTTTTTSIDYRPAGIILKCRPFSNDEGYIDSILHIEVSAPSYVKEMKAYSFQKRSVDTRVRLRDGETLVIGGLISQEEKKDFSKIPFLGDIPILGQFFRNKSTKTSEEEIMIFIKAQILQ